MYTKNHIKIKKKSVFDMVKIFGSKSLCYGKCIHMYYNTECDAIKVTYNTLSGVVLNFLFKGDDFVVIYDKNMKKIASCSVIDSTDQTARERVQQIIQDAYGVRIFLD